MRIYISGPITDTDDAAERFSAAAERIKAAGHTPVNPERFAAVLPDGTWAEYMTLSRAALHFSEGVLQLNGWDKSRGATEDRMMACVENKLLLEEDDATLELLKRLQR